MSDLRERLRARLRSGAASAHTDAERAEQDRRRALAPARRRITLTGRVTAVTVRPRGQGVTDLVLDLAAHDDVGSATSLVLLGRREVAGIRPGTNLRVHGMAASVKGRQTLFNPAYELLLDEELQ